MEHNNEQSSVELKPSDRHWLKVSENREDGYHGNNSEDITMKRKRGQLLWKQERGLFHVICFNGFRKCDVTITGE